jgi:hypothetical protein
MKTLPYKKIFMNAFIAFFIYGTWAYSANHIGAILSAFTQGSMSFVNTFILAISLEIIHIISTNLIHLILYVIGLFCLIVGTQAIVHYIIGTENILLTLLPGMTIGTLYMIIYLLNLYKGNNDIK